MKFSTLLLSALCTFSTYASAQNIELVSLQLNRATFEQFTIQIEQQTSFRFYYKPQWTDSLSITLSIQEQPVSAVLEKMFEGTDLKYAIDDSNNIYITRDRSILTTLLPDFYNDTPSTS